MRRSMFILASPRVGGGGCVGAVMSSWTEGRPLIRREGRRVGIDAMVGGFWMLRWGVLLVLVSWNSLKGYLVRAFAYRITSGQ